MFVIAIERMRKNIFSEDSYKSRFFPYDFRFEILIIGFESVRKALNLMLFITRVYVSIYWGMYWNISYDFFFSLLHADSVQSL